MCHKYVEQLIHLLPYNCKKKYYREMRIHEKVKPNMPLKLDDSNSTVFPIRYNTIKIENGREKTIDI